MTRQLVGLAGYVLLFAFLLFVPAGTLHWPAAWILLATLAVVRGASITLLWRTRRALLEARTAIPLPQAGQPLSDRLLLPATMAAFAGLVAFTARDVWHWHLIATPPLWLRGVGLLAFTVGWGIVHLALRANAFALTVVRLQQDRAQQVVQQGAYAFVRHPMYLGLLFVMTGLALALGSVAGVAAAVVPGAILALRIVAEERLLRTHLPGYAAYGERVRWRLLPGIW
jgi:protein-S-isoprenylcysteine O-methyltransferase Ste14